jgi:hypothetical protein
LRLCAFARKKKSTACDRLSFFGRVFLIKLSQRSQAAKGYFLCGSPSLRDILFFVHAKAQSLPAVGRKQSRKGVLIFTASLLCETFFFFSRKGAEPTCGSQEVKPQRGFFFLTSYLRAKKIKFESKIMSQVSWL